MYYRYFCRISNIFLKIGCPINSSGLLNRGYADKSSSTSFLTKRFMMHVHPDFFGEYPKEQKINEKNVRNLKNYLDLTSNININEVPKHLIFYQKPKETAQKKNENSDDINSLKKEGDDKKTDEQLNKVIIKMDASILKSIWNFLVKSDTKIKHIPHPPGPFARHSMDSSNPSSTNSTREENIQDFIRKQYEEFQQNGYNKYQNKKKDSDYEIYLESFVKEIMNSNYEIIELRKYSFQHVETLIQVIKEYFKFKNVEILVPISSEVLVPILCSFISTCRSYRKDFKVTDFSGFNLVFTSASDESFLDESFLEAKISLDPSATPTQWRQILMKINSSHVKKCHFFNHKIKRLTQTVSGHLFGLQFEKGLSASQIEFGSFLKRLNQELKEVEKSRKSLLNGEKGDLKNEVGFSYNSFHLRVEASGEGVMILKDGTIQVNANTSLERILLLMKNSSQTIIQLQEENQIQQVRIKSVIESCQKRIGLNSIKKGLGVTNDDFLKCVSKMNDEIYVKKIRSIFLDKNLKKIDLVIGRTFGISESGAIQIPWDWALDSNDDKTSEWWYCNSS